MVHEEPGGVKRTDERWSLTFRQAVVMVLVVLLVVFALVNLEDVKIDLVFTQVTVPVFVVIAIPALVGFFAGALFQHQRARRARRRR